MLLPIITCYYRLLRFITKYYVLLLNITCYYHLLRVITNKEETYMYMEKIETLFLSVLQNHPKLKYVTKAKR